eukprot:COSAG06_NODE_5935_length_3200_cov_10.149952_2_plen_85_part_00
MVNHCAIRSTHRVGETKQRAGIGRPDVNDVSPVARRAEARARQREGEQTDCLHRKIGEIRQKKRNNGNGRDLFGENSLCLDGTR